jgi:RNA polymerase sigma-70 factor (ECF subfamily)
VAGAFGRGGACAAAASLARAKRGTVPEGRDDLTLMECVARSDATALDRLYVRHAPLLFALCVRILRNRPEAEEVLQEVFWEVWRSAGRYSADRGSPRVYLLQLTRSRALSALRVRRRRDGLLEDAGGKDAIATELLGDQAESSALSRVMLGEESQRVRNALRALPEAERCVLMLGYFDGFSQSEIATKLGEPLGTVKTRMRRGLLHLREMLVDDSEKGGMN